MYSSKCNHGGCGEQFSGRSVMWAMITLACGPRSSVESFNRARLIYKFTCLVYKSDRSASDFWSVFWSCRCSFHKWFLQAHLSSKVYMAWSPSKSRQLGHLSHFVNCIRCQKPPGPLMSLTWESLHFTHGGCVGLFLIILVHRKLSFNYTKLQFFLSLLHPAVTPLVLNVLSGFACVSFQATYLPIPNKYRLLFASKFFLEMYY